MVEYKPCEISCYNIYTVYQNLWRAGEYCRLSVLILEFMPKGQKIIKKTHFLPNNVILIFNNTVYGRQFQILPLMLNFTLKFSKIVVICKIDNSSQIIFYLTRELVELIISKDYTTQKIPSTLKLRFDLEQFSFCYSAISTYI